MSLLLETCVVPVLGSTYKVNYVIDSHCLVCHVELSATPKGLGVAFAMIFWCYIKVPGSKSVYIS